MKAFLLHRDADFNLEGPLPAHAESLSHDLELDTVLAAMAGGDPFLFEVSQRVLLASLHDPEAIVYRQQVLSDCLANPSIVRELYVLAGHAIKAQRSVWGGFHRDAPRLTLSTAVQKMELLVGFLRKLRAIAAGAADFRSPGFTRFFTMLTEELDEPYMARVDEHLNELKFRGGMLFSAQLSAGNKGKSYTLRRSPARRWVARVFDRSAFSFTIPERDESGFRALGELEDKGVNLVANALAQSVEHVLSFLAMLRTEIGFCVACLNLHEALIGKGEPICVPVPLPGGEPALSAAGLYDAALTLTIERRVVGNDVVGDGKSLMMITGANQGGKSTFLRSVGQAQLMMQCGMFVCAESFRANVCDGVFTHFKREEDETMQSGKLDEELARMSEIADHIASNSMLLCNESFASTNEREGSQIARQIVHAALHEDIKLLFVTHMFDLANGLHAEALDRALFLRAERGADGARPFKLIEGRPLPTSYGEDSFRKVFGRSVDVPAAALPEASRS